MFTTPQDFDLIPYNIPDAQESNTLQPFIDEQEEKRLIRILGRPLYNALIEGLAVGSPEQKWLNISVGCDYKVFGRTYHWDGLVLSLKPFIYSEWLKINTQELSTNGVIESENENATTVPPLQMMCRAWNDFAEKIGGEHVEECYFYEKNTLFGMLYNNRSDYDAIAIAAGYTNFLQYLNEEFMWPGRKNMFGV